MITTAILNLMYLLLWGITSPFRLLGDVSLPQNLYSSLATAGSYFNSVGLFLPITTIFSVFGLILTIETFVFAWKILNWVRKLLPTQS